MEAKRTSNKQVGNFEKEFAAVFGIGVLIAVKAEHTLAMAPSQRPANNFE